MLIRTLLQIRPRSELDRITALLDRRTLVLIDPEPSPDRTDVDLVFGTEAGVGGDLVEWVRSRHRSDPSPAVVCLTSDEDPSRRAALLAHGCLAVLNLRLSDRELRGALQAVVRRAADQVRGRVAAERRNTDAADQEIVAGSPTMRDSLDLCRRIAPADTSVLLLGETGVGKERLARAIHGWSRRAGGPFVAVNCGAIPEGLLESELFGHERGAFTGAVKGRRGHFEMAHGGTLFLDEIGEMPLPLQVKLLRALDQRRIQPVGSEVSMPVDIRLVAATHRNLEQEVDAGRFRADLFYRLAVISVSVPPLRTRPEDVAVLVDHYVPRIARELGRPTPAVAPGALAALTAYRWPGNVRELMNVLERAVLLSTGGSIERTDLPSAIGGPDPASEGRRPQPGDGRAVEAPAGDLPLREARRVAARAFEREYLRSVLAATRGRVGEAANRAGVNPRTFYDLVRRHGLRKEEFRG